VSRKTRNPFNFQHFDSELRYDVYFESAQCLVTLRNVRILGLRTWEEFDEPDEVGDAFVALQDANDKVVFLEAASVTMLAEAGTSVALEAVPL
jgi:hypothetical protein